MCVMVRFRPVRMTSPMAVSSMRIYRLFYDRSSISHVVAHTDNTGGPSLEIPVCAAANSASVVDVLTAVCRLLIALIGKFVFGPFKQQKTPDVDLLESEHPA